MNRILYNNDDDKTVFTWLSEYKQVKYEFVKYGLINLNQYNKAIKEVQCVLIWILFFKEYPFYYLDKQSIIEEHLTERIGKFKEFNFYLVENEYSSTKYDNYKPL